MGICPNCQKEQMIVIGTDKHIGKRTINDERKNWFFHGDTCYFYYTVWYCNTCNVIMLREPDLIYG